jgi:inner membrane protein
VPFHTTETQNETGADGKTTTRTVEVEKLLYISPIENKVGTTVRPEERRKSIYRSVLYEAQIKGHAAFALPPDLPRFGVTADELIWDRAELRIGASDARGLTTGGTLVVNGQPLAVQPGKGPGATGGQGFFAFVPWKGEGTLAVDYAFALRGSRSLSLVPRGGHTTWDVASSWASPSFGGAFLPEKPQVSDKGSRRATRSTSWRSARRPSRPRTRARPRSTTAAAMPRSSATARWWRATGPRRSRARRRRSPSG